VPTVDSSGAPPGWTQVAEFSHADSHTVTAAAHADGIYVVAGTSTAEVPDSDAVVTQAIALRSVDGRTWNDVALPDAEGLGMPAVLPGPDRGFLLYGMRSDEQGAWEISVLRSTDGAEWKGVQTDLPANLFLVDIVKGDQGYVLLSEANYDVGASLWFSPDGVSWERTHDLSEASQWIQIADLAAGDDGFVAFGMHADAVGGQWLRSSVVSADGRQWVDIDQPFGDESPMMQPEVAVSAFRDGWVAATPQWDATARLWRSPDGRSWDEVETIAGADGAPRTPLVLTESGGSVYLGIGPDGLPRGRTPDRIWRSGDGDTWEVLSFGPITTIGGVAEGPDGVILAGMAGPARDVVIWLGP
jgi:hypothetical protein